MTSLLKKLVDLIVLLGLVVLLFTAGRVLFYLAAKDFFDGFLSNEIILCLISGIEYDLWIVLFVNLNFVFLFLWPSNIYNSIFYQGLLKTIYFLVNGFFLFINLIDIRIFQLLGNRLRAFEFQKVKDVTINDISTINFQAFVSNYLSLTIYLLLSLIFLWLGLKLIKQNRPTDEKFRVVRKVSSVLLVLLILATIYYFEYHNSSWLSKLYHKADRRLASLVVNNPYLFIRTYATEKPDLIDDWDFEEYLVKKEYKNPASDNFETIFIVVFQKSDKTSLDSVSKAFSTNLKHKTVKGISREPSGIFKLLDELLFSLPGFFENGICQSAYSLNPINNLVEILQNNGFSTNISVIGYDETTIQLIKNFYGFNKSHTAEQFPDKKYFKLILINDSNEYEKIVDEIRKMPSDKMLTFCIFTNKLPENENDNRLTKIVDIYSSVQPELSQKDLIGQLTDIKPSILDIVSPSKPFISYGKSLFATENRVIFQSNKKDEYKLLMDSLLLDYSEGKTNGLFVLKNNMFLNYDYKDSLAVERILLENKLHSILYDFQQRLVNNNLE